MVNFNPMGYIVRLQSDAVNTKEIVLPVCDKPYNTRTSDYRSGRRLKNCGTMHSSDSSLALYSVLVLLGQAKIPKKGK